MQKPGGPVLPGKPLGLFLNLFLHGLILNAFMASLGTRWGFRCLKPVLRPYFLRGMSYSFPKPVLHVPNVERDTERHSDDSLNSSAWRLWSSTRSLSGQSRRRMMGIAFRTGEGFSVPRRGFSGSLYFHTESRFQLL